MAVPCLSQARASHDKHTTPRSGVATPRALPFQTFLLVTYGVACGHCLWRRIAAPGARRGERAGTPLPPLDDAGHPWRGVLDFEILREGRGCLFRESPSEGVMGVLYRQLRAAMPQRSLQRHRRRSRAASADNASQSAAAPRLLGCAGYDRCERLAEITHGRSGQDSLPCPTRPRSRARSPAARRRNRRPLRGLGARSLNRRRGLPRRRST